MSTLERAFAVCNALAAEHVQIMLSDGAVARSRLVDYGAAFYGSVSSAVFGDYGVGPNHVLPTGGTARFTGGLSVLTFLRTRTWLELEPAQLRGQLVGDVAWLARVEGLEGHARAVEARDRTRERVM